MIELDKEQCEFIKTLLEDELSRLLIKRSNSSSVKEFDNICGERMEYIRTLIKEMDIKLKNICRGEINAKISK